MSDPTDLDGPVAAPDHHAVLFEDDVIRVLRTTIRAGDTTPVHTHLTPTVVVVISGSHYVRRHPDGTVRVDTRADASFGMPRVFEQPAIPPHTLENPGPDDLVVIGVEIKGQRSP